MSTAKHAVVELPERFVDVLEAASFLSIKPRLLLTLARQGHIPAYPISGQQRRHWLFRLSELAAAIERRAVTDVVYVDRDPSYRSKPVKARSK